MRQTESPDPQGLALDTMDAAELVRVMNEQDRTVADAVAAESAGIAEAVELLVAAWGGGGRWVYVGSGTSGRVAAMDAAECVPTFGIEPGRVLAIVAGGSLALGAGVEGAEDDTAAAVRDLEEIELSRRDAVIGISASGSTPYTTEAVRHASRLGCSTVGISNNSGSALSGVSDVGIEVSTGPEVLAGSTRLKAGTAQKMVLNILSTAAFCRLGRVYGNLMVDMTPTNGKLRGRAARMVSEASGVSVEEASKLLREAGEIKPAIVMGALKVTKSEAETALRDSGGDVRGALRQRDYR